MKAPDFDYVRPSRIEEAVAILADPDRTAIPLAGGQSLMAMMNFRVAMPEVLVDLGALDELRFIRPSGDWVEIGAMTRWSDLMSSPLVAAELPLLARALPEVAHPAIRNRGTIGGSVALADPAAEAPAVLLALGAEVVLHGPKGRRVLPVDGFFLGHYETRRDPAELIVALRLPCAGDRRFGFHEIGRRHGDFALAGVALACAVEGGVMRAPRIALFGVSDRALRATGAEAALDGRAPDDAAALQAAVTALDEIDYSNDIHASAPMRRHLAGVALRRALTEGIA